MIHAPLHKLLLSCSQVAIVPLLVVDPDQLLGEGLWEELGHLERRPTRFCDGGHGQRLKREPQPFANLILVDPDGRGRIVLAVKAHVPDGVLVFHPIVKGNDL